MKLRQFFAFGLLALTFVACEKKDKEKPRVNVVEVNGAFFNRQVTAGEDLNFVLKFEDDKELKEYFIEIKPEDPDMEARNGFQPFNFSNIQTINGRNETETFVLNLPSITTGGLYNIFVEAKDASGNRSNIFKFELFVKSPNGPEIAISDLVEGGERVPGKFSFTSSRGRGLRFTGLVIDQDDRGIESFRMRLLNKFDKVEFDSTVTFHEDSIPERYNPVEFPSERFP